MSEHTHRRPITMPPCEHVIGNDTCGEPSKIFCTDCHGFFCDQHLQGHEYLKTQDYLDLGSAEQVRAITHRISAVLHEQTNCDLCKPKLALTHLVTLVEELHGVYKSEGNPIPDDVRFDRDRVVNVITSWRDLLVQLNNHEMIPDPMMRMISQAQLTMPELAYLTALLDMMNAVGATMRQMVKAFVASKFQGISMVAVKPGLKCAEPLDASQGSAKAGDMKPGEIEIMERFRQSFGGGGEGKVN